MVAVRRSKRNDIDFVLELVKRENWGYLPSDIERCLELEPYGFFVAGSSQNPVGHVFSISYGKMGWVGLLIVRSDHRGRGIGTLLTKTALNYLRKIGVETVQLEAVQKAVPLYQRFGFRKQFDSIRYRKEQMRQKIFTKDFGNHIHLIRSKDLKKVASFDCKHFGANRFKVLEHLHRDYPYHCLMAENRKKTLGYIMARKTEHGYWLGPWVCTPKRPSMAKKLLISCMQTLDHSRELKVGMPSTNLAGNQLMETFGFKMSSKSIRMCLGDHKNVGNVKAIYGIGGPEKG